MKNVLVFCASEPKARSNYRKTILSPIQEEMVLSCFPSERHGELRAWQEQAGGFFAWGLRGADQRSLANWQALEPGDCVFGFFHFRYQVISRLIGKAESVLFADKMWGRKKDGSTWEKIIFLLKPREVSVPASSVYPYMYSTYRGATRIGSKRIESIIKDFGSVEAFVAKYFRG